MKKIAIGLAGKAEHGKSAAARIISEDVFRGLGVAGIFEISGYIYQHCTKHGYLPEGLDRTKMTNDQLAILVREGNAGRKIDPMYWANMVTRAMELSACDVVICPNIRFAQEAEAIRKMGGYIIRINRLNQNGSPFVSTTRDPNDITETALDYWPADFYLYNVTGHGALLEQQVITLFEYIAALETK